VSSVTATETLVGVMSGLPPSVVDGRGGLRPARRVWDLTWWVGADDRWHAPEREVAVRQSLVDAMPVVRTAMKIPGGDAVQHVYGAVLEGEEIIAVEIANESAIPFVVALVVRGAAQVAVDHGAIIVDGRRAVVGPRPPSRWAVTRDGSTEAVVTSGRASSGPFPERTDRAARLRAAFLYPVVHRTSLRVAIDARGRGLDLTAPGGAPGPAEAARGWRVHLARGMGAELPDPALQVALDAALARALLAGQRWRGDPEAAAALEAWGHDAEAALAWSRLTGRQRRRLRRERAPRPRARDLGSLFARPDEHGLASLARWLVDDEDGVVSLVPDWPDEWRGAPLDVRNAPTRRGAVSYSVRWHGDRPALIWEVPPGVRVRASGLDPAWSSEEARGEVLLAGPAGQRG
jgi:hypothetical protein